MSRARGTAGPGVVRLVAVREIRERLRTRSFWVVVGLTVLGILAIGVFGRLADDTGPGTTRVGLAGRAGGDLAAAIPVVAEAFDREAEVSAYDDADAARAALDSGDLDVALVVAEQQAVFADEVDEAALGVLQQAWAAAELQRRLGEAGLSRQEAAAATSIEPLEATTVEGDDGDDGLEVLTGTLAAILLLLSLQTFGGYVLTGVVEEKATGVVEVLLVRLRADQLLAGKILGIGVAALASFAALVVAGLGSLAISGTDVPSGIWSAVPMTLAWFLLGYAFYSTLFALAGSLVSRQEDAQAASAPIITAMIAGYMVVFFFGYDPESTTSVVLSMVPPVTPFLMPMRMAAGAASVVEVVAALGVLALATLAAWKVTARIYEQVLLHRGTRIAWRSALSLLTGARRD